MCIYEKFFFSSEIKKKKSNSNENCIHTSFYCVFCYRRHDGGFFILFGAMHLVVCVLNRFVIIFIFHVTL